jgi:exodeoxyribonuclease V alpha subunit
MRELINCGKIPVYELTKNQRIISASEDEKTILENANALIDPSRDKKVPVKFKEGNGFYILPGGLSTVGHIINGLKRSYCDLNDILILSPYRAYLDELNTTVQEIYLSDSFKFEQNTPTGVRVWRVGDRVMMTKNNYSIKVMNGQTGIVREIDDEGVKVDFNGILYTFGFDEEKALDKEDSEADARKDEEEEEPLLSSDLIHSYAVSIHKSQGSEADYIILYLENKNNNAGNFLNINLLYTAITRTRKTIWIVSDKHTLEKVSITPMANKVDGLADRLKM